MSTSPFVLLPSSHARAHDTFPESEGLEQRLRAQIRGEVRFDASAKALYATDASNYRHVPIGVVLPLTQTTSSQPSSMPRLRRASPVARRMAPRSPANAATSPSSSTSRST